MTKGKKCATAKISLSSASVPAKNAVAIGAGISRNIEVAAAANTQRHVAAESDASAGAGGVRKISSASEAESVLLEYLNRTNRPFSALNIHDNLHGVIGKTVITGLLDSMAERGTITAKSFGKFRLYWASQAQYADLDAAAADPRVLDVPRMAVDSSRARRRAAEASVAELGSALTALQIEFELVSHRTAIAAGSAKLAKLDGAGVAALVTPAQRSEARASLDRYRKVWAQRKRMVVDVIGSMADALEMKTRALYEEIGIETDEDAKLNIKDFA